MEKVSKLAYWLFFTVFLCTFTIICVFLVYFCVLYSILAVVLQLKCYFYSNFIIFYSEIFGYQLYFKVFQSMFVDSTVIVCIFVDFLLKSTSFLLLLSQILGIITYFNVHFTLSQSIFIGFLQYYFVYFYNIYILLIFTVFLQ